jgi:hypothetical protein
MSGSITVEERAINVLRELHAAEEELVSRAVVMSNGKPGTIDHVYLDSRSGVGCTSGKLPATGGAERAPERRNPDGVRENERNVRRHSRESAHFPSGVAGNSLPFCWGRPPQQTDPHRRAG